MTDVDRTSRASGPPPTDAEVLISRLVDGEGDPEDRERFERLAAVEPSLWRQLAVRQQELALLGDALESHLHSALQVELPPEAAEITLGRINTSSGGIGALHGPGASISWLAAMVGWAAVLALSVVLAITVANSPTDSSGGLAVEGGGSVPPRLSAEEHWRAYLQAPFVSEEMSPIVLESEPLADGGIRLHIIRRLVEVYDLTPSQAAEMFDGLDELIDAATSLELDQLDEIRRTIRQQAADPAKY